MYLPPCPWRGLDSALGVRSGSCRGSEGSLWGTWSRGLGVLTSSYLSLGVASEDRKDMCPNKQTAFKGTQMLSGGHTKGAERGGWASRLCLPPSGLEVGAGPHTDSYAGCWASGRFWGGSWPCFLLSKSVFEQPRSLLVPAFSPSRGRRRGSGTITGSSRSLCPPAVPLPLPPGPGRVGLSPVAPYFNSQPVQREDRFCLSQLPGVTLASTRGQGRWRQRVPDSAGHTGNPRLESGPSS